MQFRCRAAERSLYSIAAFAYRTAQPEGFTLHQHIRPVLVIAGACFSADAGGVFKTLAIAPPGRPRRWSIASEERSAGRSSHV